MLRWSLHFNTYCLPYPVLVRKYLQSDLETLLIQSLNNNEIIFDRIIIVVQLQITKRAHYYLEKRWDDIIDWSANVVRKLSMVIAKNVGALLQAQFVNNRLAIIMIAHPFDHFLTGLI